MRKTKPDLQDMNTRYRAQFINSLSGFKSANLVGTANTRGQTNLAVMSSAFHLGASPALMGLIVRPDVAERHTLDNIRATGVYTLNHIHADMFNQAHQTSARYARQVSEFDAVGLSPQYVDQFKAPAVAESRIKMGLELQQEQEMEINGTHLLIGEIVWVELPEEVVEEDGYVDITRAETLGLSGLDAYCDAQIRQRLPYAKVPD